MGLRNLIKGKYICAQAHAHSNNSEVDKCNEVFRQKNKHQDEKEIQLAKVRAEEARDKQRTLQMKYYAEAARDVKIAQMKSTNNNALTFNQQAPPVGNRARALPLHDSTNGTQSNRQILPALTGNGNQNSPTGNYVANPNTALVPMGFHNQPTYNQQTYNQQTYNQQAYNQPTYNQPTYNQPTYNQPMYNQPAYIQPTFIQPQYIQPNFNQPAYNQPTYNQPAYFEPVFYQPNYFQPNFNQPTFNQPTYSQPNYNQPVNNQLSFNQPSYNQPINNQPTYNRPSYNQSTVNRPSNNFLPPIRTPSQNSGRFSRSYSLSRLSDSSSESSTSSRPVDKFGSDSYHSSQQAQASYQRNDSSLGFRGSSRYGLQTRGSIQWE